MELTQTNKEQEIANEIIAIIFENRPDTPPKKSACTRKLESKHPRNKKVSAYASNIELEKELDTVLNNRLPELFNVFLVSPYIAPNGKNNGALRAVTIANQLQVVNILRHLITVIAYKPVLRDREDYQHYRAKLIKYLSSIMALKCFKTNREDIHAFIVSLIKELLKTAKQFFNSANGVTKYAV